MFKYITNEEKEILDLLIDAHHKFIALKTQHPQELTEWLAGIHQCQDIIALRVARAAEPNIFMIHSKINV